MTSGEPRVLVLKRTFAQCACYSSKRLGVSTQVGVTRVFSVRLAFVQGFLRLVGSANGCRFATFYASVCDCNFPSLVASLFSWRCLAASFFSSLHAAMNLRPPSVTASTQTSAFNAIVFQSPVTPNARMSLCTQSVHSFLPTPSSPHCALKVSAHVFGFCRWSYQMYVWYLTTVSKYIQQYCYYYAAAVLFFSSLLQSSYDETITNKHPQNDAAACVRCVLHSFPLPWSSCLGCIPPLIGLPFLRFYAVVSSLFLLFVFSIFFVYRDDVLCWLLSCPFSSVCFPCSSSNVFPV